jgi:DNA-binding PadR family transcriptional regulator
MNEKTKTSFSLTEKAQALLGKLAEEFGMSQSAVLEMLIRERARKEGIEIEESKA